MTTANIHSMSWRMAWLTEAQRLTSTVTRSGRTGDARNVGRLAVALEGLVDDETRQAVVMPDAVMRSLRMSSRAFYGSLRRLTDAGLIEQTVANGVHTIHLIEAAADGGLG